MSVDFEYDTKDIYLKKEGEKTYIGLHSIGVNDAEWDQVQTNPIDMTETVVRKKGFNAIESWGNEYVDGKMVGRGSFRVFSDIEDAAKEFEADGWIRFTPEETK